MKRTMSFLLAVVLTLSLLPALAQAAGTEGKLTPGDLTFRKVWTHRNMFNSELRLDEADLGAAVSGRPELSLRDGQLHVENNGVQALSGGVEIGEHTPYGAYDIEVTEQSRGSEVRLELVKDEKNKVVITQTDEAEEDTMVETLSSRLDMADPDLLTKTGVYDDNPPYLQVTKSANGIRFAGGTGRGESFVPAGKAAQGTAFETTVSTQTTGYANLIVKLRKDAKNGVFFVQRANNGSVSYEIFQDGKSRATGSFTPSKKLDLSKPYVMRMEIDGKNVIFSRESAGEVDFSQAVDVSGVFDLTDPEVLEDFEYTVGGRIDPSQSVEYTSASVYTKEPAEEVELDLSDVSSLTKYNDMVSSNGKTVLMDSENGELVMRWDDASSSACESFVAVGKARQGMVYEVTVSAQDTGGRSNNAYVLAELRMDQSNRILFVSRENGNCNYEMYKSGFNGAQNAGSLALGAPSYPYKLRMELRGKNVILSRVAMDGTVEGSATYDVSSKFDLTDPDVLDNMEFAVGARFVSGGSIAFSQAGIRHPETDSSLHQGELKMEAYADGKLVSSRVLADGAFTVPYTIRADFAAKSSVDGVTAKTGTAYLNVWRVQDGKATLTNGGGYDIDLKIDFSNPEVLSGYRAYLGYTVAPGGRAAVSKATHYLTGGAAQADPKPLHNQRGEILREGSKIWVAMTTRGYSINSSYQGIYSLDFATNELELVGTMAFNLCENGERRYGPYHASDIVYDENSGRWIVMTTSHINGHQVCSGVIPEDPRTGGFQFVDVRKADYPGSVKNEEDASLIFDEEAGKWRLVMCHTRGGGYQLPLFEADTWDGTYTEIARYAEIPCTGIQLQKLDGQYYVFFGRNTDNCEALYYPEMTKAATLNIQSSPRSYNVWPVIIPIEDETLGITRYFMLSFDRDAHTNAHAYGNIYLYEAEQAVGLPQPEEDAGAEELEPIEDGKITSVQQLMQVWNNLSGSYTLEADLNLSGVDWTPIGTMEAPFTGSFDGNGHTITNLSVNRPHNSNVGLFGVIGRSGTVSNLTVRGASVTGRLYTGVLAGRNEGQLTACNAGGRVETYAAGGVLAGMNIGKIQTSHTAGEVLSTGGDSVGGFVGINSGNVGAIDISNKGIIRASSSKANVTGYTNVGGFVGQNDCASVSDCYAAGNVEGVSYVGGFAGHIGRNYGNNSASPMDKCFALGHVEGRAGVGGFAGHNDGVLTQCYAAGNVSGGTDVGGFAGYNNNKANVISSFAAGEIDAEEVAGALFGRSCGSFSASAASAAGALVGNSPFTVAGLEVPDLTNAETYSKNGVLNGYSDSVWVVENGSYPALIGEWKNTELDAAREALEALYQANRDRTEQDYTEESWSLFQEKLAAAKAVLDDADATLVELNQAKTDLQAAADALEVNKDGLANLIEMIENELNEENFTPESVAVLRTALEEAKKTAYDPDATVSDVKAAADVLREALLGLAERADLATLRHFVKAAEVLDLEDYIPGDALEAFQTVLAEAQLLLADENAVQSEADELAEKLRAAMEDLQLVADRETLHKLVQETQKIYLSKYTAKSAAAVRLALNNALEALNNPDTDEAKIVEVYNALNKSVQSLVPAGTGKKKSRPTAVPGNLYGTAGILAVKPQDILSQKQTVVSDTTVPFTLQRGTAYCFKMTVVNGSAVPLFTVGNGNVLKTQFVARIGSDCYYRVWAVGKPGESAGIYTTFPGHSAQKHCTVTVA